MSKIPLLDHKPVDPTRWDLMKCSLFGCRLAVSRWHEVCAGVWWRDLWCQRCGDVILPQDLERDSRPRDYGVD